MSPDTFTKEPVAALGLVTIMLRQVTSTLLRHFDLKAQSVRFTGI